jgi:quercetin dioxygenase-like cupin family protein
MATAGNTMAGLDTGELPSAGFTHTSLVDRIVEPAVGTAPTTSLADVYAWLADAGRFERGASSGLGVDLDISGPTAVETTYTLQPADPAYRSGWHYHNGPVIFTVTTGTLTFVDDTCQTFDLIAGHTYIGSSGQVLDAVLLPEKNPGVPAVGWFTTRLYPEGAAGPIAIEAPCEM